MTTKFAAVALPEVTLVAATSVALNATVEALSASMRQADFGEVLLLSDREPPDLDPRIEWRRIGHLSSRREYSRFMLHDLVKHIATKHALCVQWDGYVLDGSAWKRTFLDYDYIGAPWPQFDDGHNVGNGGFSLRSRRLIEACSNLPVTGNEPEDIVISRKFRSLLEEQGLLFAPATVAQEFSYERTRPRGNEFGFHGAFNLVRHVSKQDAQRIFRSLEAGILARSERWELFRWAIARGRFALAMNMLMRLV